MAEWLAYGLEQAYADSPEIGIVRKVRQSIGLLDECKGDVHKWVEQSLANEKPAFVAIMLGLNDRHPIRPCGSPGSDGTNTVHAFRSKEWAEAYGKEVDEAIALLKAKGVPVFWVGLAPARNIREADIGFINDIVHEHADKAGIGYIDVWDAFVDEDGDFSMRGPDVNGQTRLLRAIDGLNFTKAGARKLAFTSRNRSIGRHCMPRLPSCRSRLRDPTRRPSPANGPSPGPWFP